MINLNPNKNISPQTVAVLGSTGSVGTQTLDIVREQGLSVDMLTAGENTSLLAAQIREFSPKVVAVGSESAAKRLRDEISAGCAKSPEIIFDTNETYDAIEHTHADMIFHSVAGLAGIGYALAAARSGKRVGMANKEAIIACGDMIFDLMNARGGEMIPVDSEHSAIYRCLEGRDPENVKKIILTASGGPFFGRSAAELKSVTAADALAHPTWKMGKKITVDSATLMNKGFEIIEAVRLFGKPEDKVDVVIHRQSIIHSMIEYNDNTFMAQMGRPDMRDCIRYAATAPHSARVNAPELDLTDVFKLTFEKPDTVAFPLLEVARISVRMGGTAPTSLIAADEVAVDAFLAGQIGFTDISSFVIETLGKIEVSNNITEESVYEADRKARELCRSLINKF
ncbi:MAG: 1-deoxy-D-xylulose-5-phosphate reductoisomerase [Ruminococcaceae bacterium]|nr:1-deoxy-D-xylulose-5-phosphate reductoisomerase [Oscillospiraceae bacterium]